MTDEIRQVTPEDDEVSEEWVRETGEQILGVSGCRIDWLGVWHIGVAPQEFFRQDPLGLGPRQRAHHAMDLVPGVTGVAEKDNETWQVSGSPSGEALVWAVASVIDDLAPRMREAPAGARATAVRLTASIHGCRGIHAGSHPQRTASERAGPTRTNRTRYPEGADRSEHLRMPHGCLRIRRPRSCQIRARTSSRRRSRGRISPAEQAVAGQWESRYDFLKQQLATELVTPRARRTLLCKHDVEVLMVGPGWAAVWTLVAGITVTIVGAAATLIANRRNDRLKAQLDFVNMQLRYFYGPLLANAEANQRAWTAFKRRYNHKASGPFWDPANPPTIETIRAWHHWVTTVFMPLNIRSIEVISERADLLIGNGMPQCLTDLCAHVLTLKAVLAAWQDDPDYLPQVPSYPSRALLDYLEQSFSALKREQFKLLKAITETSEHRLTDNSAEIRFTSDRWQDPPNLTTEPHEGSA